MAIGAVAYWSTATRRRTAKQLPPITPSAIDPKHPTCTKNGDHSYTWGNRPTRRNGGFAHSWAPATNTSLHHPDVQGPFRGRQIFDLPYAQKSPTLVKRARAIRVRFVDEGGIDRPAPKDGRRQPHNRVIRWRVSDSFNAAGNACSFTYSACAKYVNAQPDKERCNAAKIANLSRRFVTETRRGPRQHKQESDADFHVRAANQQLADAAESFVPGRFVTRSPWLLQTFQASRLGAARDLSKAFDSNVAKQAAQRARNEPVKQFTLRPRPRGRRLTFVVPKRDIVGAHKSRLEARGDDAAPWVPTGKEHIWTRLKLPKSFGGVGGGMPWDLKLGPRPDDTHGVVWVTGRAPLDANGHPLGDVRFVRVSESPCRWNAIFTLQAKDGGVKPRPPKPLPTRAPVFLDPGKRKPWVGYAPATLEVVQYAPGATNPRPSQHEPDGLLFTVAEKVRIPPDLSAPNISQAEL